MALLFDMALIFLLSFAQLSSAANATSTPSPIAMMPSQFWDGNDGPWSTFSITVGTPSQSLRLLPATGQSATWPILPEGCSNDNRTYTACSDSRGETFFVNQSTTWDEEGIYSLSTLYVEQQLGVGEDARGHYGFDTVGLSWPSEGLPSLENMVVGGIADKTIYEGVFPLSPRPVNFTDLNNPHPTILHTLVNQSMIPSTSWSYTAGAYNTVPKLFGSLTLGGYDTTRFVPNSVSIPFGQDISRDLLLALQSVTTNLTSTPLMSTAGYWFIDSLVAPMWFPEDVCTAFEEAFGIQWDADYSLYLINDTQHELLTEKSPTLTFQIAANTTTDNTVSIVMPYTSLALNASWPVYPNTTRYFPLKRAVNDTQYTLGRAFLQNAYVITNYDNSSFSVHQALFPDSGVAQNIVPIQNINVTQQGSGSPLTTGAIVGIAVAGAAVVAFIALAIWLASRRKKQRQQQLEQTKADEAAELEKQQHEQNELDAGRDGPLKFAGVEMEAGDNTKHEMMGDDPPKIELYGQEASKHAEMEAQVTPIYEMPAGDVEIPELETPEGNTLRTPQAELEAPAWQRFPSPPSGGKGKR